jgi:hypothetical protein
MNAREILVILLSMTVKVQEPGQIQAKEEKNEKSWSIS